MSGVRILIGTRKGAFILKADGMRKKWRVEGPHFGGWEIFHMKGSPADPNRIFASQTSAWFGQIIQRSDDGGKTWRPTFHPDPRFKPFNVEQDYVTAGVHQFYQDVPTGVAIDPSNPDHVIQVDGGQYI